MTALTINPPLFGQQRERLQVSKNRRAAGLPPKTNADFFGGDAPPLKRFIVESFYIAACACVNKEKVCLCMRYFRTSERSFLLSVKLSICKGCVCFSKEIDPIFTLKYNISVFRTPSVFSRFLHHFLAFRHKMTRFSASCLSFFGTIYPLF